MCLCKACEKLIDECRFFAQSLLFSGFHNRAGLDASQDFRIPVKKLAELWADVGSFPLGHLASMPRASARGRSATCCLPGWSSPGPADRGVLS